MAILDVSYCNLKCLANEKYTSGNCTTDIDYLKELFESDINSTRCLSHISDVASLMVVLEKRGVLSPVNIGAFDFIYSALQLNHEFLDEHNDLIKSNHDCLFTRKYEDDMWINEPSQNLPGYKLNNLSRGNYGRNIDTPLENSRFLSDRGPQNHKTKVVENRKKRPAETNLQQCQPNNNQSNAVPTTKPKYQTNFKHKPKDYKSTSKVIAHREDFLLHNKIEGVCGNCIILIMFLCDWFCKLVMVTTETTLTALQLLILVIKALTPGFLAVTSFLTMVLSFIIQLSNITTSGNVEIHNTNQAMLDSNQYMKNHKCRRYRKNYVPHLPNLGKGFRKQNRP